MKHIILFLFVIASMCSMGCENNCAESCTLIPEVGPCNAAITIYYYDQTDGLCKEFIWGGCDGVVPFETFEACQECACD